MPRRKINKKVEDLNNNVNQLDLTDIYKTLYPTTEYAIFLNTHRTFSRADHKQKGQVTKQGSVCT